MVGYLWLWLSLYFFFVFQNMTTLVQICESPWTKPQVEKLGARREVFVSLSLFPEAPSSWCKWFPQLSFRTCFKLIDTLYLLPGLAHALPVYKRHHDLLKCDLLSLPLHDRSDNIICKIGDRKYSCNALLAHHFSR